MIEILRSRVAMIFLSMSALAIVVAKILGGTAYAILSSASEVGTYKDLAIASAWFSVAGSTLLLVALSVAAWQLMLQNPNANFWEVAGATVAALLYTIGNLVTAANAFSGAESANILEAIGLGGVAIILAADAGRQSLRQSEALDQQRTSGLWLSASAAVLLIAISTGLPNGSLHDRGLAMAASILSLVGAVILIATLKVGRIRVWITWPDFPVLMTALWLLVIKCAASLVVATVVYGSSPSLTSIRVSFPFVFRIGQPSFPQ